MPWSHRAYATAADPARQSDLSDIASPHGCSKRFFFRKTEQADGEIVPRERAAWKPTHGSAIHAMIARALAPAAWVKIREHGERAVRSTALFDRLGQIYDEEVLAAAEGLPIDWREQSPAAARDEARIMVRELLCDLLERIERPLAVEAPFLAEVDAPGGTRADRYHVQGTADLLYEPKGRPGEIGLADWKTGAIRMHPVVLAHGYQVAIYAHAVERGRFWPGTAEERVFGVFPSEIHVVHLRELVPYAKRTAFSLERAEEVEWARARAEAQGLLDAVGGAERFVLGARVEVEPSTTPPPKLKKDGTPYKRPARRAGRPPLCTLKTDRRGPAWYAAPRTPADVARLRVSLASIVGTVRLGRFYESIGDQCERCAFKAKCLTEGHEVSRDQMGEVNRALRGLDGLDELLDYAV